MHGHIQSLDCDRTVVDILAFQQRVSGIEYYSV